VSDAPAERAATEPMEIDHSEDDPEVAAPPTDEVLVGHLVALLFAADEPLPISDVARLLEVRQSGVQRLIRLLTEAPPMGLLLQRDEDRLQLVTAPASARYVRRLRGLEEQVRLSRPALEVLAVVAYRQPATRAEIEAIRGVNGDRALATLLTRGLIAEVGRRDTVGRPVEFGTTLGFLEHLGLGSLDDLPNVSAPDRGPETPGGDPPGPPAGP
jgi:segregation and condensation protein B